MQLLGEAHVDKCRDEATMAKYMKRVEKERAMPVELEMTLTAAGVLLRHWDMASNTRGKPFKAFFMRHLCFMQLHPKNTHIVGMLARTAAAEFTCFLFFVRSVMVGLLCVHGSD